MSKSKSETGFNVGETAPGFVKEVVLDEATEEILENGTELLGEVEELSEDADELLIIDELVDG
jgi:hypothetical protein